MRNPKMMTIGMNHRKRGEQWHQRTVHLFNLEIKPKDPPIFYGRAAEDVSTWISKVSDFFYLTGATECQQVAYAATLLQEAAADWWVTLLRENYGERPADFQEFAVRLEKRFGSSTRVDRARAALRDIRQGQSEDVRAFSTRFEGLLGKLPSWDQDWAKTQFIWGLHTQVAELVTISSPSDLAQAIRKAEESGDGPEICQQEARLLQKSTNPVRWQRKIPARERQIQCSTEVAQESNVMPSMHLKCRIKQMNCSECPMNYRWWKTRMPNAIIAAGMVISYWECPSAPRIISTMVADKIVVVGTQEDAEEAVEEDAEVVEEDHSQLEPLWSRRDQMHLDMEIRRMPGAPQCLALILREQDRETS